MKPSKVYISYNFGNEVLIYIRIFIKKRAYEGKLGNIFLVLAIYNYFGFQRDKKSRGREFKRHVEIMGLSNLENVSK